MNKLIVHCSVCGQAGHRKTRHKPIITEKTCFECKKTFSVNDFYTLNTGRGYTKYSSRCKKCEINDNKIRLDKSPQSRASTLYSSAKTRCKIENIPFLIEKKDIINQYNNQRGKCYYTGVSMSPARKTENLMSLDRVDPLGGYTKENIVLCCWNINEMKKNRTENKFIEMCKNIFEFSTNRKFD